MPLIKANQIIDNPWSLLQDDAPLPASGYVIFPFTRFIEAVAPQITVPTVPLHVGVRLAPDEDVLQLADYLPALALVEIDFPKFNDGRGFSQAQLLRRRLGYQNELRAIGHILVDQYAFMLRCGFDTFLIEDAVDILVWQRISGAFSMHYQCAADGDLPIFQRRIRA